jgi:hypothetical protein
MTNSDNNILYDIKNHENTSVPKKHTSLFTHNQKTILSLDFDRVNTCKVICDYCYIENMERIYPAYKAKTEVNTQLARQDPKLFAVKLNQEYNKALNSKSVKFAKLAKLPVRIYGGGDYEKVHYEIFKDLTFPFFLISKTLTMPAYTEDLNNILELPNCKSVVLSYDKYNSAGYLSKKELMQQIGNVCYGFKNLVTNNTKLLSAVRKTKRSYTGIPEDFQIQKEVLDRKYEVFFLISDTKSARAVTKKTVNVRCPADTGEIPLQTACTSCSRCWKT